MPNQNLQLIVTFWPMILSAIFGAAQAFGLRSGSPWAYRLGIPVARLRETLPLIVPDVLPDTTESEPVVTRVAHGVIGFLCRGSQVSTSAAATGLGGASGSGYVCFGVIERSFGTRETTFVYRGYVALYAVLAWVALVLQIAVFDRTTPWSQSTEGDGAVIGGAALVFGLVIVIFTVVKMRQLLTGYHILSADLASRGVRPDAGGVGGSSA